MPGPLRPEKKLFVRIMIPEKNRLVRRIRITPRPFISNPLKKID
jgi:hypothetical protein